MVIVSRCWERRKRDMDGPSWRLTVFTQVFLCVVLCIAFLMSRPQKHSRGEALDLYFMSVSGGQRPWKHQIGLLKRMQRIAKNYDVKFVIDISELGDQDPLLQNATDFPLLQIPWYATKVSGGAGHFRKQIMIPFGNILDIVFVDTGMLKDNFSSEQASDSDDMTKDPQILLTQTLSLENVSWRIVVGFHPLIKCKSSENTIKPTTTYDLLHHALVVHGIDVYLSNQDSIGHYVMDKGITYIGNPTFGSVSRHILPHNGNSACIREAQDGFHLHRVSPLEIETYFVDSQGKMAFRSTVHQRGREVI